MFTCFFFFVLEGRRRKKNWVLKCSLNSVLEGQNVKWIFCLLELLSYALVGLALLSSHFWITACVIEIILHKCQESYNCFKSGYIETHSILSYITNNFIKIEFYVLHKWIFYQSDCYKSSKKNTYKHLYML